MTAGPEKPRSVRENSKSLYAERSVAQAAPEETSSSPPSWPMQTSSLTASVQARTLGLRLRDLVAELGPDPGHDLRGRRARREEPRHAHLVELLDVRVGDDAAAEDHHVGGAALGQQVDDAAEQRHVRPGQARQ